MVRISVHNLLIFLYFSLILIFINASVILVVRIFLVQAEKFRLFILLAYDCLRSSLVSYVINTLKEFFDLRGILIILFIFSRAHIWVTHDGLSTFCLRLLLRIRILSVNIDGFAIIYFMFWNHYWWHFGLSSRFLAFLFGIYLAILLSGHEYVRSIQLLQLRSPLCSSLL